MEVTNRHIVLTIFAVSLIGGAVVGWTFLANQQNKNRQLQAQAASLKKPAFPNPTIYAASPRLRQNNSPSESQTQLLQNFRELLRQKDALLQEQSNRIARLTADRKRLAEQVAVKAVAEETDTTAELEQAGAEWQKRFNSLLALDGFGDEQDTDDQLEADQAAQVEALEGLASQIDALREELATAAEEMTTQRTLAELEIELLRSSVRDVAVATGAPVVEGLVTKLDDDTTAVRKWAAEVLGEIGTDAEDAIGPLMSLLNDEDEQVRRAVRDALQKINP